MQIPKTILPCKKIYEQFNLKRLNVITLTASSLQPRPQKVLFIHWLCHVLLHFLFWPNDNLLICLLLRCLIARSCFLPLLIHLANSLRLVRASKLKRTPYNFISPFFFLPRSRLIGSNFAHRIKPFFCPKLVFFSASFGPRTIDAYFDFWRSRPCSVTVSLPQIFTVNILNQRRAAFVGHFGLSKVNYLHVSHRIVEVFFFGLFSSK